ncbi:hypothetical protein RND81_08G228300 [Saponaria officinalis]|uniref:Uncharacterized protein n=1 Tax=Saponaria officinalis TaxID=3572 RepID=A0AAW1JAT7_SAPOF
MNEDFVNGKDVNIHTVTESDYGFGFGLSEMEKNMSFTDLLKTSQLNEIDYDEYGTDVDDDEIVDARTKHRDATTLEKELRDELDRLEQQLRRDDLRCDIKSNYDDGSDLNSPGVSSDDDERGYVIVPTSKTRDHKVQGSNFEGSCGNNATFFVGQIFENAVEFRKKIVYVCRYNESPLRRS